MSEENNATFNTPVSRKPFPIIKGLIVVLIILVVLDLFSLGRRYFFSPKSTTKADNSIKTSNSSTTNSSSDKKGTATTNISSETNSLSVKKSTTSGWKTFTDTKHKFSLDFPDDWTQAAIDTLVFVSKGDALLQITYADPGIGEVSVIKKENITINKQPVEFSYFIPKDETVKLYAIAKYGIKVKGQKNGYTVLFTVNNKNASAETAVIKQILATFKFI